MKKVIFGFIIGAMACVSTVAFADQWRVVENAFPIKVDNVEQQVDAFNINDRTYIQLNDLSKATGLGVVFENDVISITTLKEAAKPVAPVEEEKEEVPAETEEKEEAEDIYADLVPSFADMSKLPVEESVKSEKFSKVSNEYKTTDGENLKLKYAALLEENGFVKITGINENLEFNDVAAEDDVVYRKGELFVSVELGAGKVTVNKATNSSF